MQQPPDGQTQTLMPALMPLLSTSTTLERLSFADCCFDHGDLEWLHLAPKTLRRLDLEGMYLYTCGGALAAGFSHLGNITSLNVNIVAGYSDGFPDAVTHCKALRRLALTEDEPSELHPLPESITRLSRLELLLLKNTGISALPSSISALRSLRNLRALSVSMLVHQPLLLQLMFLTRLEVSELPSASAAVPIERGFRHLRDAGALQLVENTEVNNSQSHTADGSAISALLFWAQQHKRRTCVLLSN